MNFKIKRWHQIERTPQELREQRRADRARLGAEPEFNSRHERRRQAKLQLQRQKAAR